MNGCCGHVMQTELVQENGGQLVAKVLGQISHTIRDMFTVSAWVGGGQIDLIGWRRTRACVYLGVKYEHHIVRPRSQCLGVGTVSQV